MAPSGNQKNEPLEPSQHAEAAGGPAEEQAGNLKEPKTEDPEEQSPMLPPLFSQPRRNNRHLRPNTERARKDPLLRVKNDLGALQWCVLEKGEGSPETLHQLARAVPLDIRRWAFNNGEDFRRFVLRRIGRDISITQVLGTEEALFALAARIRAWARRKLCRALIPARRTESILFGRDPTTEYRQTTTDFSLDWTTIWSDDTQTFAHSWELKPSED
ncbi:hypothetical protein FALBO_13449 [Fusarium albosuccineum]|uniref:Uncharacterized protein n=1 Tax=Fusarium albosuccineum TaxID=1237068 RepID=A0A8H4KYG2_9HYPO|nr:hypothetical protein FALBO_13449 [Fusarium albosuccineum]